MSSAMSNNNNSTSYDSKYYSNNNVAYVDGYSLEERRRKYADVIANICEVMFFPWIDLGCGPGFLVQILRDMGREAYGCDFSEVAIKKLSDLKTRRFLKSADLRELPYTDSQFRSSSSFHVLEHIEEKYIEKVVMGIVRITKSRFYGIIPTVDGICERDNIIRKRIYEDVTHRTIKNRVWWADKFTKH